MSQFEVYPNPARQRQAYPYVVQLQSDVAAITPREVVIAPLVPASMLAVREAVLLPLVHVSDRDYRLCVPMLGTAPANQLANPIGDVSESRWKILAAIDHLFTGG